MIYTIPNIITDATCDELIDYYKKNPHRRVTNDAQPMFNGKSMNPSELSDDLKRKMEALKQRLTIASSKFYHLSELYLDHWSITHWNEGDQMEYHADNVTEKREPHWYCHWRNYSSIVYLNQDYGGGHTHFQFAQQRIIPEKGMALIFPAGYSYTHGVTKIKGNARYTVATWFTGEEEYCKSI